MALPHVSGIFNLAQTPNLRMTTRPSGDTLAVLEMRLAANSRRQDPHTGAWTDRDKLYIDAVLFGAAAADLAPLLAIGSRVSVEGSICTEEWTTADGDKRSKVKIKAKNVHRLAAAVASTQAAPAAGSPPC